MYSAALASGLPITYTMTRCLNQLPLTLLRVGGLGAIALSRFAASCLGVDDYSLDPSIRALAADHCTSCHNPEKRKGKLDLESIIDDPIDEHLEIWDEVAWMLKEREMPPEDAPEASRPSESEYEGATDWLEAQLTKIFPEGNSRETFLTSKRALINQYCVSCHNPEEMKGDLSLETVAFEDPEANPEFWETVIRRLDSRQMPPPDRKRPSEATYEAVLSSLIDSLDTHAAAHPQPGRVDTFRRLNRTEYQNAIRDLLGVEIDARSLLPKDEESHGFDNVTLGTLAPSLLDRYITAAQKVSRLAIGRPLSAPKGYTYRIRPDVTQEKHVEGLPLGTRGGAIFDYTFPRDGEYEIEAVLTRDRNEHVEGLKEEHEMDILLGRKLVERFTVAPPEGRRDHSLVDKHLKTRVFVEAGPKSVGVTFLKNPYSLLENKRQPFKAHYNHHRHPRLSPAIYQVSITGPFNSPRVGDTPSRKKIFIVRPESAKEEEPAARTILSNLMERAFRRPISKSDLERPLKFYRDGAEEGGFESGIEAALNSILVSPEFLFRIEKEPRTIAAGDAYRISDIELASRMSFFLWSSLPDEELLDLAIEGRLSDPENLNAQVARMLPDDRSRNLVENFAGQWLHLRNLEAIVPDLRLYPDFDDNLRQAFWKETELFVESVLRENRSVLDLLKSDYTFLNERLAQHYEIPGIFGSGFRRVPLKPEYHRGGLLRQGSILTVTSYATRTSPVIRGNWVLENILGTPAKPPPPDVPALEDNKVDASLPMRERLAEHRANPACASCHDLMDPVGFALENFDAVGRWRVYENGAEIDVSGGLPDGSVFAGVESLENGLLERPELFVRALTEKLLIFALGRGVEPFDAPAVRKIVSDSKQTDYQFSSIIEGIVKSVPFQMRTKLPSDRYLSQTSE